MWRIAHTRGRREEDETKIYIWSEWHAGGIVKAREWRCPASCATPCKHLRHSCLACEISFTPRHVPVVFHGAAIASVPMHWGEIICTTVRRLVLSGTKLHIRAFSSNQLPLWKFILVHRMKSCIFRPSQIRHREMHSNFEIGRHCSVLRRTFRCISFSHFYYLFYCLIVFKRHCRISDDNKFIENK